MRSAFKILCVFAMLGMAITIGIAWTCALIAEPGAFDPQVMAKFRREFFALENQPNEQRQFWVSAAYPGIGVQFADVTIDEPGVDENYVKGPMPAIALVRAGWPWVALEGQWEHDLSRVGSANGPHSHWGFELKSKFVKANRFQMPRMLPLRPLWKNFVLNVIFIGGGLWLLCILLLLTRRKIRSWRALCPACAYPVGVSQVCTECGKPLRKRVAKL